MVLFIPHLMFEKVQEELRILRTNFLDELDLYFRPVYPRDHDLSFFTISNNAEWHYQFTKTRPNKEGKHFRKGFIQINANTHEKA